MPKKIKPIEIDAAIEWINGTLTFADFSRKIKNNPRHMQGYVRIALVMRHLASQNKLIIKK